MNVFMHYQFDPEKSGWSKTDTEGNPGLSVFEHCRHVGWVVLELMKQGMEIPHTKINHMLAAIIAACHDIGKWSPGFLQMCPVWLEREGLKIISARNAWEAQAGTRHEKHSQDSIQLLLQSRGFRQSEATAWAIIAGAHHGKMHRQDHNKPKDIEFLLADIWHSQRLQVINTIEAQFGGKIQSISLKKDDPIVPWLMGLTSVADWIGSDENHFPVKHGLCEKDGKKSARLAIESIGLCKPWIKKDLWFEDIFGFNANEMQLKAQSVITKPGIYIIEAPMGLGKTEAALACAYELLQSGQASGLYFALPTQLTSNRIHLRVSGFVKKITHTSDKTRLAHANAWLEDGYYQPRPVQTLIKRPHGDATASRDWFASAKRALLANFGVGTIDQALMAVVAVKHFFVRRFALSGKVVIIDEVHSYDHFTGTLVRCLCQELQKLGCTIIILSATLLPNVRNELLDFHEEEIRNDSYPLITGKSIKGVPVVLQGGKPKPRPAVKRIFKSVEQIITDASNAAFRGARVLWVCNTVNAAQEIYRELIQRENKFKVGLLHSRFPHFIRQRQEEYWMERLGKKDNHEGGCILVSTQIVEQSVDIDSDILISELAPMDMLLQRMGRLWRHLETRPATQRPVDAPEIWIVKEQIDLPEMKQSTSEQLKKVLGTKAKVYQPYVLLKTYETLHMDKFDSINIADQDGNSDIRELLKLTYRYNESDSDSWNTLHGDVKGTKFAEKQLAIANTHLFAKAALNDEEGKQTRLINIETIPLLIATRIEETEIFFLNGECIAKTPEKFDINHARTIHKNITRVHAWSFETVESAPAVSFYLKGNHCLAVLGENNGLKINGLKSGITIQWSETLGIVQTYKKGGDDESCD
ncbi:MAG: CRISPR-associated helicase Cas3' [Desulfobacteraceae bacterium]|nr:CRISPR-associated helicase Cas3' [Desulfobacteraceae bacterium]